MKYRVLVKYLFLQADLVAQQRAAVSTQDEKLQQTIALSITRLENYQKVRAYCTSWPVNYLVKVHGVHLYSPCGK